MTPDEIKSLAERLRSSCTDSVRSPARFVKEKDADRAADLLDHMASAEPVPGVVLDHDGKANLIANGDEDFFVNVRGYSRVYRAPQPAPLVWRDMEIDRLRAELQRYRLFEAAWSDFKREARSDETRAACQAIEDADRLRAENAHLHEQRKRCCDERDAAADLIAGMAQRVPLSDEQINAIVREHSYIGMGPLKFVRLIEQAHGIRQEDAA